MGPENYVNGMEEGVENVLVLAGIIFFIVANMGYGFGFVLKTVLAAQSCFSYC